MEKLNMIRIGSVWLCLLLLTRFAAADLKTDLTTLFESKKLAGEWSVAVQDAETKKPIYGLTPKRQLIPASNMKVVAGAAGMLSLGPDYTYKTHLYAAGKVEGGVLKGDLIVVGSGDPSIGGHFTNGDTTFLFDRWLEVLKQKQILKVDGNIYGVDDIFDDVNHGLNWNPIDFIEWYAAEVSGLSFNDGCVDIVTTGANKAGLAATVGTKPPTSYVTIQSAVKTGGKQNGMVFKREVDSNVIRISGAVSPKARYLNYVTINNPTHFFVSVFKEELERGGVGITGQAIDADDEKEGLPPSDRWSLLDTYESPRFELILGKCLKDSQNLFAEHILKTVGAKESGVGSYETGVLAIKNLFFEHGCNLDDQYVADGSGLSRENRMSSQALVQIHQVMHDSPFAEVYRGCLAQSGVDGTLKRRMGGTPAYKRVFAKTGTMKGISSLSGYVLANSGKMYIFAMIGNAERKSFSFTNIMDDACAIIAEKG